MNRAYFVALLAVAWFLPQSLEAQTVSGAVYRDFNASGTRQMAEVGVAGINVTAFDATGAAVGNTATLADGTYSAALSVGAGTPIRVEFSNIPSVLEPGPFGDQSGTTVDFAQSGDSGIDVGLANPGQHCPDSVDISTVCFLTGPQDTAEGVIVSVPETGGSDSNVDASLFDLPAYTAEAAANEVGAVWGLAYRPRTDVLYASAFIKRLSDLGPTGNPTTIYQLDRSSGTVSSWVTLDGARSNPHSGGIDGWSRDFAAFDDVFKEGLGDLDISEDGNTLYTVDLGTRDLVSIAINQDGTAGTVTRIPIASTVFPTLSADGCASLEDVRPFGLGINDGALFVGVVCSGQSSVDEGTELPIEGPVLTGSPAYPGDTSVLRGYVFAWDGGVGFTEAVSFPLDYSRGCAFLNNMTSCASSHPGLWRPWVDTYPFYDQPGAERHSAAYPQPMISDIEFDTDGDMLLGLNDRWGHQTGPRSVSPAYPLNEPPNTEGELRSPFTVGDLLRACVDGSNSWRIEELIDPGNTGCGTVGSSSNAGGTVVTDEYFYQDDHASTLEQHAEVTLGGLTQIPGRPDVISAMYDPVRTFTNELDDGGLAWYSNVNGSWTKAYRLYDGDLTDPGSLLLKAAGVGDVAPFCEAPSIEIGNRVWNDTNPNGLQDPGESGLDGVTVLLVCGGSQIASTMTSNLGGTRDPGSYLFNDSNVTDGVPFNSNCEVRISPVDPNLGGRVATLPNAVADTIDSDGVLVSGFLTAAFLTGGPGANNHTFDFGFTNVGPASITVSKTANPTTLPEPGGNVTYTVMVTNNSPSVGVTITSLVDDVSGNLDGQGTCSVPQVIAASGSYSCQYTVMVNGNPGDTVTCTTTATGTDANTNPVSDDDSAQVTITAVGSSIVVTKTANPTTLPEPAGNVTYTVSIANTSAADSVTITSLVDDVSGDLNGQGTCSVPQVIAPGGTYNCQYTVPVNGSAGDIVTCTVTATGTDDDGDPVSDDDSADVTFTDIASSIEVIKTAFPTTLQEPGGLVTYTVLVTNTGGADTVTIDSLIDDVSGDLNGQGTCVTPQVLAYGSFYSCEYTVMVTGEPGDAITCTVTAAGTDDDGNPVSDDDSADVTITDVGSSIIVMKNASPNTVQEPGGLVTYTTLVTNTSANDTVTIDSLIDDVSGDLNGQGTCSVPQMLAPGSSYSCEYSVMVTGEPGGTITCTVTATGTDDDGSSVSDDDSADVSITDVGSSIVVTKDADPSTLPAPGGDVTYSVSVTNTSAVDSVTVTSLVDNLSGDLNGQGSCSVPQVLAPGGSYSCEYTITVSGTAGDSINCIVTATGTDDDGNPVNDSDPAVVTIVGEAQLLATKVVTGGDVTSGGTLEYEVVISNVGQGDQANNPGPEFADILPPELTLLDAFADSGVITLDLPANQVEWDGAIASGDFVVITIIAAIGSDVVGEISNQGCVFSDTNGDGDNDLKTLTDDPTVDGPEDPTVVEVIFPASIPTLHEAAMAVFAGLLLLLGIRRFRPRY